MPRVHVLAVARYRLLTIPSLSLHLLLVTSLVAGFATVVFLMPALLRPVALQTRTFTTGDGPNGIGVNSALQRVYIAERYENRIAVRDLDGKPMGFIPSGRSPHGVAANTKTSRVYVANYVDDSVMVIDGKTDTVVTQIPVGTGPWAVAVNESTNRVYVTNRGYSRTSSDFDMGRQRSEGTVSVIDGANNQVITAVKAGVSPAAIDVNAMRNRVYVADADTATLRVIDGATNLVLETINLQSVAQGIAVDELRNRVFVAMYSDTSVWILDGTTDAFVSAMHTDVCADQIAINPKTNRVYIACNIGNLSVVDGQALATLTTSSVDRYLTALAVDATGNHVYVTDSMYNKLHILQDQD
jgi:YVTN family beta-propeller protein